ncbi:MAG: Dabb family protein [Paludibacteraceae bacterium]|nr:Dabb family protein [Paludibacteraceae bacterium]
MVKHIILWKLRSDLSEAEKREKALAIKQGLEGLKGQVPGLIDIHVQIDGRLETSNADIMLDSTLDSFDSLKGYAVHPAHLAVANGIVRPNTELRTCLDFEEIKN